MTTIIKLAGHIDNRTEIFGIFIFLLSESYSILLLALLFVHSNHDYTTKLDWGLSTVLRKILTAYPLAYPL